MIAFIDAFFTISLNHNQFQWLTVNIQPNPSSLTTEDSIHCRSRSTTVLNTLTSISSRHGPHTENSSSVVACVSIGVLT
jgi:hypothetical protein